MKKIFVYSFKYLNEIFRIYKKFLLHNNKLKELGKATNKRMRGKKLSAFVLSQDSIIYQQEFNCQYSLILFRCYLLFFIGCLRFCCFCCLITGPKNGQNIFQSMRHKTIFICNKTCSDMPMKSFKLFGISSFANGPRRDVYREEH